MSRQLVTSRHSDRPRTRPGTAARAGLVLFLLWGVVTTGLAQERTQRRAPEGFPDLVSGLKATPGVVGVETARTSSGKEVIFAWFENKAAALRWYYSDMHLEVQNRFFPDRPPHTPLAHVPDDTGPILAIASLTLAESAQFGLTSLPVSQIRIELYTPLPGGFFLGGRFAPASVPVPHMWDIMPKTP